MFLQSVMLLLHSQRRYVFEYDQTDRLIAVTMPSMAKHNLRSLLSIGYYRNMYTPPDSLACFLQDYTLDGRLLRTQYLGTGRSVIYRYLTNLRYEKTWHWWHGGVLGTICHPQNGSKNCARGLICERVDTLSHHLQFASTSKSDVPANDSDWID